MAIKAPPSPPDAAAQFLVGPVMHARLKPVGHRFTYQVFALLIDLSQVQAAGRLSRFFSVDRPNLLSFRQKDHGPTGAGDDPATAISRILTEAGLKTPPKRLLLLCYPRVFGFVFNPISIYFAYDSNDELVGLVYEVRNTFGDKHCYVAPIKPGELSEAGLRQSREKVFYVSPFLAPRLFYHFRIRPPDSGGLAVRILEKDIEGPILAASFSGRPLAITDLACLRLAFGLPLMTLKVVAAIHFEALRLWFKGVRFFHRPPAPPAYSVDGAFPAAAESRADHANG